MIFTIDQYLTLAEAINSDLAEVEKKKEINLLKSQWGGHGYVKKVLAIACWWKELSQEWQEKILELPFKLIRLEGWVTLTQLSEDKLSEWFEGITLKLQEKGRLVASDLKRVATPLLPEKPKSTLKLGEQVTDDEFDVVQRRYRLSDEDIETFKIQVLERYEEESLVTEHLFYYLELMQCNPMKILVKGDRMKWVVLQKDQEIEAERSLRLKLEQEFQQKLQKLLNQQSEMFKGQLQEQREFYEGLIKEQNAKIARLEQQMHKGSKSKKKSGFLSEFDRVSDSKPEPQPSKTQKKQGFASLAKT